ncbi:MAG: hypothetical protein QMC62_06040 [Alteromonadaceae bacterium]|jgi:hypothetical protein
MRIIYTQPNSFTINLLGECQFSIDDKRQLSVTSRIGFWGCWLVFEKHSSESKDTLKKNLLKTLLAKLTLPTYFIFKTSLSPKQYSRLCRIILKLNNTTNN